MLLNNVWVKNQIEEQIRQFLETNENEQTTVQNLWDTVKAVLRGKLIVIQAYLKKQKPTSRKKTQKHSNSWRLKSMLLNDEWVNNEIKEEIKKFLETN